ADLPRGFRGRANAALQFGEAVTNTDVHFLALNEFSEWTPSSFDVGDQRIHLTQALLKLRDIQPFHQVRRGFVQKLAAGFDVIRAMSGINVHEFVTHRIVGRRLRSRIVRYVLETVALDTHRDPDHAVGYVRPGEAHGFHFAHAEAVDAHG